MSERPQARRRQVIVVGGGMAGLSTAYLLTQRGYDVLVLESSDGPGGRARSLPWRDGHVEAGAMFFAEGYEKVGGLIDDLGLRSEMHLAGDGFCTAIREDGSWTYVDYVSGRSIARSIRPREIPPAAWGAAKLAWPAVRSARGIRRLAVGDINGAPALDHGTLGAMFGPAAVRLSALPEGFLGYGQEDIAAGFTVAFGAAMALSPGGLESWTPAYLAAGTGSLTAALAEQCEVEYGVRVEAVRHEGTAAVVTATGPDGSRRYEADAIVLATTADVSARLWTDASAPVRSLLEHVRYSQILLCYYKTDQRQQHPQPDGRNAFFELYTRTDEAGRALGLAYMDWMSPTGNIVATGVVANGAEDPVHALSDAELADQLLRDVARIHPELPGTVIDSRVVRLPRYVPVYEPGYLRKLHEARLSLRPGPIDVAGDYLGSPTLEGAATSAEAAAARVEAHLQSRRVIASPRPKKTSRALP